MAIERFIWTLHAERRRKQRLLDRGEVERAIRVADTRCPRSIADRQAGERTA